MNIKLKKVLTCNQETSVLDVIKKLKEHNERRIFVVDDEELLVGVITTVDIVYKFSCSDKKLKAEDIMSKDVLAIDNDDDLGNALEIMDKLKSYVCPVTKDGKIIGLISYHDVLAYVMSTM